MTELDHVWSEMLSKAAAKAVTSGQLDIADYLRLKAANDAIRTIGVGWLLETIVEIAGHGVRRNATLIIEREEPHNFSHGNSNIVGSLINIRHGVRCLTVEAGWTRTPRDGIMRGGALAFARITHFGFPKIGAELRLVRTEALPHWIDEKDIAFDSSTLRRHFDVLLGT